MWGQSFMFLGCDQVLFIKDNVSFDGSCCDGEVTAMDLWPLFAIFSGHLFPFPRRKRMILCPLLHGILKRKAFVHRDIGWAVEVMHCCQCSFTHLICFVKPIQHTLGAGCVLVCRCLVILLQTQRTVRVLPLVAVLRFHVSLLDWRFFRCSFSPADLSA